jgi:hypothetical protein
MSGSFLAAVRRLAGALAVAALAVGISAAYRASHPAVVRSCCAYSPERLAAGAWWTVFGSALLVVRLKLFGINTALLLGIVVPYALREGSRRALAVFFAGHVVATLAVAAVVLPLAAAGWHPAEVVRIQMDVGASAGVAAVAGAMAVSARRRRLGAALFAGLAVFFAAHLVAAHTLSEAEHLIALATGALIAIRWQKVSACSGVPSSTVHGVGGTLDPVVRWPARGDGSR